MVNRYLQKKTNVDDYVEAMEPDEKGGWVEFEDHCAEIKAYKKRIESLKAGLEECRESANSPHTVLRIIRCVLAQDRIAVKEEA